jgi:hypothetical protein
MMRFFDNSLVWKFDWHFNRMSPTIVLFEALSINLNPYLSRNKLKTFRDLPMIKMSYVSMCKTNGGTLLKQGSGSSLTLMSEDHSVIQSA